jgi:hypothetical protein
MMECWNAGIVGSGKLGGWLTGKRYLHGKNKESIPSDIKPIFHYSTIPLFQDLPNLKVSNIIVYKAKNSPQVKSNCPGQGQHINFLGPAIQQQPPTFIHGSAGGIDIINEQYLFPHDRFFALKVKGIFYVARPLGAIKLRLRCRGHGSDQNVAFNPDMG